MAHGEQNILETAGIDVFMLCMYIQVLVGKLRQQIADIMDYQTKSFYEGSGRRCKHAGFVFVFNFWHWRFQIAFYQQLHTFCTGFHWFSNIVCKQQSDNHGSQDRDSDYRNINGHGFLRGCQVILLRRCDGDAPAVRIWYGSIGDKHLLFDCFFAAGLEGYIASKAVFTCPHLRMDISQFF